MSKYIVVKAYTDGTFTTEFFRKKEDAQKYAEHMRNLKFDYFKEVVVYEATDY